MAKNLPKLMTDTKLQIQETQTTQKRIQTIQYKTNSRHTLFKLPKKRTNKNNCQKQKKEKKILKADKNN